jgi:hemin uptake protein HemP
MQNRQLTLKLQQTWIVRILMGELEMVEQDPAPSDANQESKPPPERKAVAFETLAQGAKEVLIQYGGQVYRLRLTRNGKLILNK